MNTQAKEQKNSEIVLLTANVTSGGSATGGAATIKPTAEPKEIVTVTPFSGLWKYYGQKRTFIRDVHYAVSDEKDLPDGVTLTISSETAGKQQFVLKDERSSDEKQKISYQLAKMLRLMKFVLIIRMRWQRRKKIQLILQTGQD